ncbi:MAG: hypothetical protein WD055_00060 [Candidatus Dependentiae bacterium]
MFKKIALIVLLSISSLQVAHASEAGFMQTVKNSPGISKWLGTIVPNILAFLSMEWIIRANKDNPDRQHVVSTAKCMRFMSFIGGLYFFHQWFNTDFKEWTLSGSSTTLSTP